jgi:hypothetical protein
LLSHATSKINPAATAIIFKRFKQHSMSAQSYISVGRFQPPKRQLGSAYYLEQAPDSIVP